MILIVSMHTTVIAWESDQNTWAAPWSWMGPSASAKLGLCVASGGDVNGDGIHDMIFAAPYERTGVQEFGTVYVVFGSTTGWQPEQDIGCMASASFKGEAHLDHPGGANERGSDGLAIVPSINGDMYDDIIVVSPGNNEAGFRHGKVYIILGKETGWGFNDTLNTADASFLGEDEMGKAAVSSAGDVNGDGRGDFLVGAPFVDSGKAYLILGKDNWASEPVSLSKADASWVGEADATGQSRAGFSVAGVPDLNGDGCDEILIGAPKYTPDLGNLFLGKAYLILGRETGWTTNDTLSNADMAFVGITPGSEVGSHVATAGDTDNDGKGDILITSPVGNGHVYLFLGGSISPPSADMPITAADTHIQGAGFSTGDAMSELGDTNGDGYDDFAIGAPIYDSGPGKAYALFGRPVWPAELDIENSEGSWRGVSGKFWAGSSVAGGDVDNDGLSDIVIGAGADPFVGFDAGSVCVIPSNYGMGADQVPPDTVTSFQAQVDLADSIAILNWNTITVDENGNAENVLFYRLLRYSYVRDGFQAPEIEFDGILPAVLDPEVSVTDSNWTPWNDTYSSYKFYLIHAIDEMGNASEPSEKFSVLQFEADIP